MGIRPRAGGRRCRNRWPCRTLRLLPARCRSMTIQGERRKGEVLITVAGAPAGLAGVANVAVAEAERAAAEAERAAAEAERGRRRGRAGRRRGRAGRRRGRAGRRRGRAGRRRGRAGRRRGRAGRRRARRLVLAGHRVSRRARGRAHRHQPRPEPHHRGAASQIRPHRGRRPGLGRGARAPRRRQLALVGRLRRDRAAMTGPRAGSELPQVAEGLRVQ